LGLCPALKIKQTYPLKPLLFYYLSEYIIKIFQAGLVFIILNLTGYIKERAISFGS